MGRHRKRRRAPHRMSRRIALVSAGLLIPLTGGAVVFAATTDAARPAAHSSRSHGTSRPPAAAAHPGARPQTATVRPAASPTPAGPAPATQTPASPPAGPRIGFAPYADVLAWPPLDLPKTAGTTHVKDYTLGFVAAGGGCSAAWGGLSPLDDPFAERRIKAVPGKLIVSFGGPRGTELARSCGSVDDLAKQYQAVLDATDPAGIDFFLNEGALADGASVERRTQALARLQGEHTDLGVSITLPLHRSGLSGDALDVLHSAADGGLRVSTVNLIPADGDEQSLISSATAAHGQLQHLYHQSDAQVWQRMGVTPVIGIAAAGTGFRPADAEQLVAWAQARGLGRLSMWSVTRDTPCTLNTSTANDTCSGLDEDAGAFSKIFQPF
ncbi:MAG: Secreted sugar hydrolase [Actinoallomurus sp.]|nr:Secreted sugar hydrolase [Actinoallomurus sp.]